MNNQINAVMGARIDDKLGFNTSPTNIGIVGYTTGWDWWERNYYPQVIKESYPVYIQERAQDKGKQAFEIIKVLKDKKLLKLDTVGDFIEAMDTLIKTL